MPRRARRTGTAFVDNERERDITFSKRRNGLFNAASDLSILTGVSIAVVLENQSRERYHAIGTPMVETVVNAELSSGMEPTEPFADEQLRGRLALLETELARLNDESEKKKEKTKASKDRYRQAQEEEEDDDEDDAKMKRLLFTKPDNLNVDEMNELCAELFQIREQVRERLPSLRRRGGEPLILGSSVEAPLPPPPAATSVQWQPPQWSNLFGPAHNQLLPVAPAPASFVADQAPPPPPPAAHDTTQLAPLPPTLEQQGPLMQQEPFLFSDHASALAAPMPLAPLQMPVENHFPVEAPLLQEPFPFSDQVPALAPQPASLQIPVEEDHLQLSPLLEEPFPISDQARTFAPIPAPSQMLAEAHFPLSPLLQEPLPAFSDPAGPALAFAPMPAPPQMSVEAHSPLSPLLQEPFDFSNQAPLFSPLPSQLQMPVEPHMPLEAPLFQEPFLVPDQAPMHDPLPAPLQMPVEAHMPLDYPLFQEPFLEPDQSLVNSPPLPAPLQMPVEAHLPPAAEAYNQEVAEQQHLPQSYENYDHMFENMELSQPLAAGAGDDGFAAVGNDNPFGNQHWTASPLYDAQFYLGTGTDDMAITVGDHGGVPEANWANAEQASSSDWGNDIIDDAWF